MQLLYEQPDDATYYKTEVGNIFGSYNVITQEDNNEDFLKRDLIENGKLGVTFILLNSYFRLCMFCFTVYCLQRAKKYHQFSVSRVEGTGLYKRGLRSAWSPWASCCLSSCKIVRCYEIQLLSKNIFPFSSFYSINLNTKS